ncbi:MAG: 3-hydroxyacyl-[acyl-carrier-protein] dehydratase FabZ, partial [Elusimicrobia bacterium]|nr:3-hydroxyacyl-[acyl-carrier-protein] dehydratase FabZ [Elusimicrobiota bacterium]
MTETATQTPTPVRTIDTAGVMKCIPHRYPFLLVDKVDILEEGRLAVGTKGVTMNEPFFQGHFPDYPIMPGVLMIEAVAQAGGALL